jgi:hypothetical protein
VNLLHIERLDGSCPVRATGHIGGHSVFYFRGNSGHWQSRLLLPESYSIIGVYLDVTRKMWVLAIESKDIPLTEVGEKVPEILPTYRYIAEDGKIEISDIKIWDEQAREYKTLWEGTEV